MDEGKPLALIIEDHEDTAIIIANAMQEAGFKFEIIPAGDTALARLAETTPDVVILDLELPRVSGLEVLDQIRADARLSGIRVIVATAYPDLAVGLMDKADLVMIKPVSFGQLRDLATRLSTT